MITTAVIAIAAIYCMVQSINSLSWKKKVQPQYIRIPKRPSE